MEIRSAIFLPENLFVQDFGTTLHELADNVPCKTAEIFEYENADISSDLKQYNEFSPSIDANGAYIDAVAAVVVANENYIELMHFSDTQLLGFLVEQRAHLNLFKLWSTLFACKKYAIMRELIKLKCHCPFSVFKFAKNQTVVINWLMQFKMHVGSIHLDQDAIETVVELNYENALKIILDHFVCDIPVENYHLNTTIGQNALKTVMSCNSADCVEIILKHFQDDCSLDFVIQMLIKAAKYGHLDFIRAIARFMRDHDGGDRDPRYLYILAIGSSSMMFAAAKYGRTAVLNWCVQQWSPCCVARGFMAIYDGYEEIESKDHAKAALQFIDHVCKKDVELLEEALRMAACAKNYEMIAYLACLPNATKTMLKNVRTIALANGTASSSYCIIKLLDYHIARLQNAA